MITDLITTIEKYNSELPAQLILKEQFLQFIRANPKDCLLRSNLSGHLTASAWVLDHETQSKCLLVHHVKLDRWLQPGGHADGESDLMKVAAKELKEETGVEAIPLYPEIFDLDVHAIPWHKETPPHLHFDVRYIFTANSSSALSVSHESHHVAWFKLAEIRERCADESVIRLAEKRHFW